MKRNKLKRGAGETLAEMLCSMLIISLGMLMLSGAITSAARVNARARKAALMADRQSLQRLPSLDYFGAVVLYDDAGAPPVTLAEIHGLIDRWTDNTSLISEIGDYHEW